MHPNGKFASKTVFFGVQYDEASDTSLVLARPITGRTHQIRAHLQHIKHPIANDPNYGTVNDTQAPLDDNDDGDEQQPQLKGLNASEIEPWVPPIMMREKRRAEEVCQVDGEPSTKKPRVQDHDIAEVLQQNSAETLQQNNTELQQQNSAGAQEGTTTEKSEQPLSEEGSSLPLAQSVPEKDNEIIPYCRECHVPYRSVTPQDLTIYLHSWKYEGPNFQFKTSIPEWCAPFSMEKIEEVLRKLEQDAKDNPEQEIQGEEKQIKRLKKKIKKL